MAIVNNLYELTDKIHAMSGKATRISDLIFIPFQAAHQTEMFISEFMESLTDKEIAKLTEQWPSFPDFYSFSSSCNPSDFAQEFANDLCLHCPFPYLVKIETANSINNIEVEDGNITGYSYSWGSFVMQWRFAKDLEHAVDQAIEIGTQNINSHAKKQN